MTKFAECKCLDCKLEFKISFENSDYPKLVHCPQCTSVLVKLQKVDRSGFNSTL